MNASIGVLTNLLKHISEVRENLAQIRANLERRAEAHDRSKLLPEEFDGFVKTWARFQKADYGSPEYEECSKVIQPSIDHHYAYNRHHVAYHKNGFEDMTLLDILEMLADWRSAANRNQNLTFEDSLPIAFKRYKIPKNMQRHILNTLRELGWLTADVKIKKSGP